ncbi:MAG: mechanosensitive ion channel family protein [Phycisphaeraceae bacterium]
MLQGYLEFIERNPWVYRLMMSAAVVLAVFILRWSLHKSIARMPIKSQELRRRWILTIRNLTLILLAVGLMMIWAEQLRTLAFSLIAVIVAVVLATKELILCLTGSFLKASSGAFTLGDRIEINNMRGDVIDQTLLSTTLMEVGPGQTTHQHTGRVLVIPNSLFLNNTVINESYMGEYGVHSFMIPIKRDQDYQLHENALIEAAMEVCQPFLAQARASMEYLTRTEGVDAPSVEPRVTFNLPKPDEINLVVRVAAPIQRKRWVEQQIIRQYLAKISSQNPPDKQA